MSSGTTNKLTLDTPANYLIKAQGWLDESWADRLAGMQIEIHMQQDNRPEVILDGRLRDQAELIGVLNSLYELRLPIMSLEIVNKNYCSMSDNADDKVM